MREWLNAWLKLWYDRKELLYSDRWQVLNYPGKEEREDERNTRVNRKKEVRAGKILRD